MSATNVNDRLAALEKQGESIAKTLDTLGKTPRFPERRDEQGRLTSYFEEIDEPVELRFGETRDAQVRKSYRQQKRENGKVLRSGGYEPWGAFKSFKQFVREGLESGGKTSSFQEKHRSHFKTIQGMSESTGVDGGVTVMPEFSNTIIDRLYDNPLWEKTDHYNVSSNNMTFLANAESSRANGSRHGGLRGYWIPEGGSITDTKPTIRGVSLKLNKLAVVVYLTQELIDDSSQALEQYAARKATEEFKFMLGDAVLNGTGAGQPLGIHNSGALVSVAKESGQLAATLETENILKMYSRFYAPNLGNSLWLHNQDIGPELFTMTLGIGAAGVVTYMPPGGVSGSPYASLMGRPMLPTEFNSTLGTQGDLTLADLSQVLSISKGGIAQAVSMHVEFLTDQIALRFTMRVDARPWEVAPITPYKGASNTQSSFVTLDTRG